MTETTDGAASGPGVVGAQQQKVPPARLSYRKKFFFLLIVCVGVTLASEPALRVVLFIRHDFDRFYLTFGLVPSIEVGTHASQQHGYTKFEPNVDKHQKHGGKTISIRINADGFRGMSDFTRPKSNDVYRIVTLGASSTFGFFVEDTETYPYQLELMLRDSYPDREIEVLNMAIPHARTDNIVALARAELPSLAPDLIVLYSGCNDARHPVAPERANRAYRLKDWLYTHSVAWRCVHPAIKRAYYALAQAANADPVGLPNLVLPIVLDRQRIEDLRTEMTGRFCSNVRALVAFAARIDSRVLLVTQSYTLHHSKGSGLEDDWRSYAEEVELIERVYAESGSLRAHQVTLLAHCDMMDGLRQVAGQQGLLLVEGIAVLNRDRQQMLSFVHLSPTGNRWLAEAVHDAIVRSDLLLAQAADRKEPSRVAGSLR